MSNKVTRMVFAILLAVVGCGNEGSSTTDSIQGPQGPQGVQGPAGPKGDTGSVGPQGPMGLSGAVGTVGQTGSQGAQGAQGPQGPQGAAGPQGLSGANGIQGPAGPTGAAGPQGPVGSSGSGLMLLAGSSMSGLELGVPITARYTDVDPLIAGFYAHQATQTTAGFPKDFIVLSKPAPQIFYGSANCGGNGFVKAADGTYAATFENVLYWIPTSTTLLKKGSVVGGVVNYLSIRANGVCSNISGSLSTVENLVDSGFQLAVSDTLPWTLTLM